MSIAATDYTLETARHVNHAAQPVLFALAARAGVRTAQTYTGQWIADALGLHERTVRRRLTDLEEAGIIAVDHRPGRSSVVRFPLAPYIGYPQPRAESSGVGENDPGQFRPGTPGSIARTPRATLPAVSVPISGTESVGAAEVVDTYGDHDGAEDWPVVADPHAVWTAGAAAARRELGIVDL